MLEKYITETTNKDGKKYGWSLWATSFNEAEKLAKERGIGETVLGKIPHDCEDCEWEGELTEEIIKNHNIRV